MNEVWITHSEEETQAIGAMIARSCKEGDFLACYGEMGCGKTVFMRGFVGELIPEARVSSPTYAVLNVYQGEFLQINHFDMYRIQSEDDLYSTGYEEAIMKGITFCEWSENIEEFIPDGAIRLYFEKIGPEERSITVIRGNE